MDILILLLLALDLRVFAFKPEEFSGQHSNAVKVVNYNEMGGGECPKVKEPLCATNGEEFVYFENKCFLEVKNYERLLQGQQEFFECSLNLCNKQCPPCGPVYDPVCAIEKLTGQKESFQNPCEVQRRICNTQKDWQIVQSGSCIDFKENKAASSHNLQLQNSECPEFCTLEYQPICARFMTLVKEFSNECELKTTICQTKQKWDIIKLGPCEESNAQKALELTSEINNCPLICTLEYNPICAKFGNEIREFANKCELDTIKCTTQQEWQIVVNGPCSSLQNSFENSAPILPQKPKCPQVCSLEYQPICAKFQNELREFPNTCFLESTKCQTEQDWEIVTNGPCTSTPSNINIEAFAMPSKNKCPEFCTLEYRPVCAKLNNVLREFPNSCALGRTICETNEKWEIVHQGSCNSEQTFTKSKCPQICTLEYRPVCAKLNNELREFPNQCTLERTNCETKENWEIVLESKCIANKMIKKPKCPQACTLEYKPICAKFNNNLREFSNNCDLQKTICESGQDWQIVKQGPCLTATTVKESECPQFCTDDLRPVCAEFNNEQREFPNNCELLRTICETNTKWEVVKLGPCSPNPTNLFRIAAPCPAACSREYNPICAKSGNDFEEFLNKCVFEQTNCNSDKKWEFVKMGSCPSNSPALLSSQAICPKFCTREYRPICAKFDNEVKEFPNKCELLRSNCETDKDWEIIKIGTCSSESLCPKICTLEYRPVCAKFDNEMREFPNKCELLRSNCETHKDWEIIKIGKCSSEPTCAKSCTREYIPVCAQLDNELREFPNKCELERINCESEKKWEIINLGTCPSNLLSLQSEECPKFCTREYNPVCAQLESELREFPNKCVFLTTNCESEKKWEIVNLGTCPSKARTFQAATDDCPQFCTREFNPVCARFETELREFPNKCEFQRINCESEKKWEIVNLGTCPAKARTFQASEDNCPKFCTREYIPLCAQLEDELREFPNKCEFQRIYCESEKKWEIVNLGTCPAKARTFSASNDNCPQFCTREYIPLCAQLEDELREFPNKCEFQRINCESEKKWEIVNLGTCPSKARTFSASNDNCPQFCTREYIPLCAQLEGELREFPNKCEFQRINCESEEKWEIVNLGTCPAKARTFPASNDNCPQFCTREYIPLCAQLEDELREFPNKCEFQRINCESEKKWEIVNLGTCPVKARTVLASDDNCPQFCTREFNPVCAQFETELKEFPNKCELLRTNCETDKNWELLNTGPCLIKAAKSFSIDLQPICATNGKVNKIFNDLEELQEEIRKTGKSWSLLHIDSCESLSSCDHEELDPICAIFEVKKQTFKNICQLSEDINNTGKKWFILHKGICGATTPVAASSTTTSAPEINPLIRVANEEFSLINEESNKPHKYAAKSSTPKTTTTTTPKPKYSTTRKITSKPKYTTVALKTTTKPNYSTTTKTTTTTTTVKYPKYTPTSSSTATQDPYSSSPEEESEEMDNSSKGYYEENVSHYGYESYENSEEDLDNQSYSWEDDEEEEEEDEQAEDDDEEDGEGEQEDEVEDNAHSYKIDNDSYSYQHNDTNSTYTYVHGKDLTKSSEKYSKETNDSEEKPEEQSYSKDEKESKKEYKVKPKVALNFKANLEHLKEGTAKQNVLLSNKKSFQERLQNRHKEVSSKLHLEQNIQTNGDKKLNQLDLTNRKFAQTKDNNGGKNLIKLIQERIWELFGSREQDNINSRKFNKQKQHEIEQNLKQTKDKMKLLSPERKETSQVYEQENYENSLNDDESLEANISYEEDKEQAANYKPSSQQVTHNNYEAASPNENEPKFGVYSDDAYDLIDTRQKQPETPQYNNNCNDLATKKEMDTYNSASEYQEPKENQADNSANVLEVFEALLAKSDADEEDDETLVSKVLTTLDSENETTVSYPTYEETENQLNYTKREQYPSKYNATNTKKGEIYNGVVYKAPVYDAPTYNFIYTAPNHPIYPLTSSNNPFLNQPLNVPNPAELATNPYNPLVPLINQTNLVNPTESIPAANLPFNPMQFLSSLAAMSSQFVAATPNLMSVSPAIEYANNIPKQQQNQVVGNHNNPLAMENSQSNLPLHPFAPHNFNQILTQTPASPQMFPPPQPEPFMSHLAPFNSMNSQMPNLLPLTHSNIEYEQNSPNKENLNVAVPEVIKPQLPFYPFPASLPPSYQQFVNTPPPNLNTNLPTGFVASSTPSSYIQPPESAFNATIFNQIVETLKTITNRS